jgi:predicted amidohydrolase
MTTFLVASAAFPVSRPSSWDEFAANLEQWVATAVSRGARLLVFPEYAALSLATLLPEAQQSDLAAQLAGMQALRDDYLALHTRLAQQYNVLLLAGSFPAEVAPRTYVNRAWLFDANGTRGFQDKQVMTRFEREQWLIGAGEPAKVFDTSLGVLGVATCYDSEFPLLVRAQAEAGARLVLVPSCTDALAGYHRVRVAAQARALESQCYVIVSPLVGEAPWSPAIDVNVGAAGVYGPPDLGFPFDGVIAQGAINEPGWVFAEVDLNRVDEVRRSGQVLNFSHWPESAKPAAGVCRLGSPDR